MLPKPDLHVRLEDDEMYRLKLLAEAHGVPVADYARSMLTDQLRESWGKIQFIVARLKLDGRLPPT